jgi:hypothetical protein
VKGALSALSLKASVFHPEIQALRNRPEAFDAGPTHINSINELQSAMMKIFAEAVSVLEISGHVGSE